MNKVMMNIQIMLMLIFILILYIFSAKSAPLAPALFVFGDSIVENGNNILLPSIAKANYPPYGMNFEKGPTGRYTNGRTPADFIAEFLGLPYAPPYVSFLRGLRGLLEPVKMTGLNYASAGSGILPQTGARFGNGLSLGDQIDLFERTMKEEIPREYKTSKEVSNYLTKSVFFIVTGYNDYDISKPHDAPQPFSDLLIHTLSQHFQRLYGLGARKVIMFEIAALGCLPHYTRQFQHNGTCVEELNEFAIVFNQKLDSMLHNLTSTLSGSSFILGRINGVSYDAIINPSKYGLSDTSNPCCVALFNGTSACIPGLSACQDPEKYYFFDGYHPTETVYKVLATLCFNGSSVCTPNIQELVSQD